MAVSFHFRFQLTEKQQFLEHQEFEENLLFVVGRDNESSFILCNVINDGLVMGRGSVDEHKSKDHEQGLRRIEI